MKILRPHQVAGRDATLGAWARGVRRPALAHATGSGKTTTFAAVIAAWMAANPGRRVLALAHRVELIDQGAASLAAQLRLPVGVMMGARNQTLQRVVMGSVQTLRSERRRRMLRDIGLVVVDEAHHAAAPSYVQTLTHYGAMGELRRDSAVALGVTATMSRGDQLALGDVWEEVVHNYPIAEGIADGWLKRPHGIAVRVADLDLRNVRTRGAGGEYQDGSLGAAIEGSLAPQRIVEAYREHAADRQGVAFLPTVHSAEVVRDEFRAGGFTAELVHAGTPADERKRILAGVRAGRVQILTNCGVFTEGTDLPMLSVAVIGRPTKHSGLYIQMAGRPLRLWCPVHRKDAANLLTPCCDREVRDALILDVVGAARRHSLSARVELFGADEARDIEDAEAELGGEGDDGDEGLVLDDANSDGIPEDPNYVDGSLAYDLVDLFGSSDTMWMRTAAGIWFIEAGERYIAIIPGFECRIRPDYDVMSFDRYVAGTARWVLRGAVSLPEAMKSAELDVTAGERRTSARGRSWRVQRPSPTQLDIARRTGIVVGPHATSGEVSERISVAMASARIDPYLPAYVTYVGVQL